VKFLAENQMVRQTILITQTVVIGCACQVKRRFGSGHFEQVEIIAALVGTWLAMSAYPTRKILHENMQDDDVKVGAHSSAPFFFIASRFPASYVDA
jgi:hypothetical protein